MRRLFEHVCGGLMLRRFECVLKGCSAGGIFARVFVLLRNERIWFDDTSAHLSSQLPNLVIVLQASRLY
jgi:hypothetical protein